MTRDRLRELVRNFSENGFKVLLEDPANTRELLALTGSELVPALDFARIRVEPTSYVAEDFRQSTRWLELLSYIHALVYHERVVSEHAELHQSIEQAVRDQWRGQEVARMPQTIAEMYLEQGRQEGRKAGAAEALQQVLLEQLRERFRKIPKGMEAVIESTREVEQLHAWLKQIANAQTLQDVGIPSKR